MKSFDEINNEEKEQIRQRLIESENFNKTLDVIKQIQDLFK